MKKIIIGIMTLLSLGFGVIFAESILPDNAEITTKDVAMEGEAINLTITMMKNGSKMSSYTGKISISIIKEDGDTLKPNEYTLPQHGRYTFSGGELGSVTFEKGLQIKIDGKFFIEVEDEEDIGNVIGRKPITIIKNEGSELNDDIDVLTPTPNSTVPSENLEVMAKTILTNSIAEIYIDDNLKGSTTVDSDGFLSYTFKEISEGNHFLQIRIPDKDGLLAGSSDTINFIVRDTSGKGATVTVDPEFGIRVGQMVKITAETDELVESVKVILSDRPYNDAKVLTKDVNGKFSTTVLLDKPGVIDISLETSSSRGANIDTLENIKQITVLDLPEIYNIVTGANAEEQTAELSWDVLNGEASSYLIKYRLGDEPIEVLEERTDTKSFNFKDVRYDIPLNVSITPFRGDGINDHGAASETIRFLIKKPEESQEPTSGDPHTGISLTGLVSTPRCIVENISTRTTKIGENYYLIWDKVENVSKYIVYSSTTPDGSDKMKVYETTDTSYQYPFDKTSEEDKFAYFWIVGICDDGEELELTGATKVQVGPAENFFLLICMTFLIYFGIKLFRQTEE